MLKMPPSLAPSTCISPAVPVSCIAESTCIETPVAPIGWPLALSPPEGFTGSLPSLAVQPSTDARLAKRSPPGLLAALEQGDVAPAHGQEVIDLLARAKHHRLAH